MHIYVTVQLAESETIAKSSSKLAADILNFLGGDPTKDTSQAAITSVSNVPPSTVPPPP